MDYADARPDPVKNTTVEKHIGLVKAIFREQNISFDESEKSQKITWTNYLKSRALLYPNKSKVSKAKILSIQEITLIVNTLESKEVPSGYR